jgi:hypothetical protein
MSNTITSQSTSHATRLMLRQERARMRILDEMDGCACCGSCVEVVREARFGYVPFCQSCLDRTLHPGMWDEFGEAGD